VPTTNDPKDILTPLNKLLEANDKLAAALNKTQQQWPYVSKCWIDQMSEPTELLAKHRLKTQNT
jgi:hypothetical protein